MIGIKGRAIYISIFLAIICVSVSIKSTEKKGVEPFVKKLIPSKILIEETGEPTSPFPLYKPISVAEDSIGNIYILDAGNHCVVKYSSDGKYIKHWGKEGQGPGEFSLSGSGSIYITNNDIIHIADRRASRIQSFDSEGKILSSFITERSPDSICVDSKGNILASHALGYDKDRLIYVYNTKGETIRRFGTPIINTDNYWYNRSFLTIDDEDNIYQVFEYLPVIRKYSSDGKMIFEKKVDLRRCKSNREEIAHYWFNYKLDESKEEQRIFTHGIFFNESSIFIHLVDIYVLSNKGEVIGLYEYDSELGSFFLPEQMMLDKKSNKFLIMFRGQDRVGAALFER